MITELGKKSSGCPLPDYATLFINCGTGNMTCMSRPYQVFGQTRIANARGCQEGSGNTRG